MNQAPETTQATIPLYRLCHSQKNVRKVKADNEYRKQLKANILAEGILHDLIVAPLPAEHDGEEFYEVGGGGNRLSLLHELHAEGLVPNDYPVPCKITTGDRLLELSLSENIHANMHPADEFTAYKELVDQNISPAEIARRFGRSEKSVKKLLKLASVAPAIIDHFRAGKLDLDCVMAFTVSDDHERQLACWKEVCKGHHSPQRIRAFLLQDAVEADDAIVKFVGLKAYKAAGGTVASDLFSSEQYLLDVALLNKLATDALTAAANKLAEEGWKWVDTSLDYQPWNARNDYTQLSADFGPIPEDLTNAIAEKEKRQAELEEKDFDELTPEEGEELDRLRDELSDLDDKKDDYRAFTPEQKAVAGCIVTFNGQGSFWVVRGLVKKEDRHQAAKLEKSESGRSGSDGSSKPPRTKQEDADTAALPQALRDDLATYHTQAFQAELMNHERLAFELLVFTLATEVLGEGFFDGMGLQIAPRTTDLQAIDIDKTAAAGLLAQRQAELPVLWNAKEDDEARFKAFRELDPGTISKIMAFCVARLVSVGTTTDETTAMPHAAELMQLDITRYWKATAANYFSRVKKDELISIGDKVVGNGFKEKYASAKKADLAVLMETLPELQGWLPNCLRQKSEGAEAT